MSDYSLLAAKIAADHVADTPEQIAVSLNEKNVPGWVPIPSSELSSYLIITSKWLPIKMSADPVAVTTIDALGIFDEFRVQDPTIRAVLGGTIDALIAGGFLNAQDKTHIMGLGEVMRSWADINWGGDVQLWQINEVQK